VTKIHAAQANDVIQFKEDMTANVVRRYILEFPPEAAAELDQLMRETGDDDAVTLFRKALALYKLAKDAVREGKQVGAAATPDCLETQFVDF
jgi:hypothetical protein